MPRRILSHLAHVELLTPRLEDSVAFFTNALGLVESARSGKSVYLRCWGEHYHHSIVLTAAEQPGLGHAAWRTEGPDELNEAAARIEASGIRGEWREKSVGHGRAYRFRGPGGHFHEVFWEVERFDAPAELKSTYPDRPQRFVGRAVAPRQIDHVTLNTQDVMKTCEWYRDALGFRFMGYTVLDHDPKVTVFGVLTTNEKSHDLGFGGDFSKVPGRFHHVAFWIPSYEELLRAADLLLESGTPIEFGPGKHGIGEQGYLYFRDPVGLRVELNTGGYRNYIPDWQPTVWKPSQGSHVMFRNLDYGPKSFMEAMPPAPEPAIPEPDMAQVPAGAPNRGPSRNNPNVCSRPPLMTPPGPRFALATVSASGGAPVSALVLGDRVAPVHALKPVFEQTGCAPPESSSVLALLEKWETSFEALLRAAEFLQAAEAESDAWRNVFVPREQLTFRPPVDLPRQVFCAGANYRRHVIDLIVDQASGASRDQSPKERRAQAAKMMDDRAAHGAPFVFTKPVSAVTGPYDPVILPRHAAQPDWEVELAVIIGKPARHVSRDRALDYIAGYTIVNDITNRDLVFRKDAGALGADWLAAKASPGYLPTGPYLVPAAFVADPQNLQITLKLNGQTMQDESTADMIFGVARVIEFLSKHVQLWPGDLIATGSPAGNGTHYNRFLKPGDVMEGSITGLGTQRNPCIAEEDDAHAAR